MTFKERNLVSKQNPNPNPSKDISAFRDLKVLSGSKHDDFIFKKLWE